MTDLTVKLKLTEDAMLCTQDALNTAKDLRFTTEQEAAYTRSSDASSAAAEAYGNASGHQNTANTELSDATD